MFAERMGWPEAVARCFKELVMGKKWDCPQYDCLSCGERRMEWSAASQRLVCRNCLATCPIPQEKRMRGLLSHREVCVSPWWIRANMPPRP